MLELWCTSTLIQTLGRGWWPSFPRNLHKGVSKLGYKHTQIVDKTKTILASWNILEYFLPSTVSQIISLLHKQFQKKIQNWIFLLFQTACLEATSMDKNSWDTPPPPPPPPPQKYVSLNAWVFQSPIFTFSTPLPFWSCNHCDLVHRAHFNFEKGKRGVWLSTTKSFFFQLWKIPKERDCFAQMCQNFCPWL